MRELFNLGSQVNGRGRVLFRWDPSGKILATCGANRRVKLWSRTGEALEEFALAGDGICLGLEWDAEGEMLAALQQGSPIVMLWSSVTRQSSELQTNMKDVSFFAWSHGTGSASQLAIGTARGNLLLFSKRSARKVPVLGKHSKEITCGGWSPGPDAKLVLASYDKTVTISDMEGNTVRQEPIRAEPTYLRFAERSASQLNAVAAPSENKAADRTAAREQTFAFCLARRSLTIWSVGDEQPIEVPIQAKYGDIVSYRWASDGRLVVGFSRGWVVEYSVQRAEAVEEAHAVRVAEGPGLGDGCLSSVVPNPLRTKFAVACTDGMRVYDMSDWKEIAGMRKEFSKEDGPADFADWTKDGQILTACTAGGSLIAYLVDVPQLCAGHGCSLLLLSSLRHVTLVDAGPSVGGSSLAAAGEAKARAEFEVAVEPSFLALGPASFAVGMNNHAWFYRIVGGTGQTNSGARGPSEGARSVFVGEREYLGSVKQICLNSTHAAVLCDGRVQLHGVRGVTADGKSPSGAPDEPLVFPRESGPPNDGSAAVTSIALTEDFLVFGTARGTVHHIFLRAEADPAAPTVSAASVNEFRHDAPILAVYPNPLGTRVLLMDGQQRAVLYSPVDNSRLLVEKVPSSAERVLWDSLDPSVFTAIETRSLRAALSYHYRPQTLRGPNVHPLAVTKLSAGFSPCLLVAGQLFGLKPPGTAGALGGAAAVQSAVLASHESVSAGGGRKSSLAINADKQKLAFAQLIALSRLRDAWEVATVLRAATRSTDALVQLAKRALEQLDVEFAIRVYREIGDAPMVLTLSKLKNIEDRNLLAGHICALQADFATAQELFLASSRPLCALEMRRDLLHWREALKLAATLAPAQIPAISVEYAQQLEFRGEHGPALAMYQQAIIGDTAGSESALEHNRVCKAGIARMTLRAGDLQRGRQLALQSDDPRVHKECAAILEQLKQYAEAAELFLKAGSLDRAAAIYLQAKDLPRAGALLQQLAAQGSAVPRLQLQFARLKEAEGRFDEAERAFEAAGELESVVRLNLGPLKNPEKAFALARQVRSAEAAAMVADYCVNSSNISGAIEFLLQGRRGEEAFKLAHKHGLSAMQAYAQCLLALLQTGAISVSAEELKTASQWFERAGDLLRAGEMALAADEHARAVKLFLQAGEPAIDRAIQAVKRSLSAGGADTPPLTRAVLDYLVGENDGKVKDPLHVYRLYMAVQDYAQAANTAVLIANSEQSVGHYREAHSLLFDTLQELRAAGQLKLVPEDFRKALLLLHSYVLIKKLLKREKHVTAARMLIRVCASISRFPSHIVPILTSAVKECHRAGLKMAAFEYSSMLMRPEYRQQIDERYKKKIGDIARRRPPEDEEESHSPCPFCGFALPDSLLDCPSCRNSIPYCASSGLHMRLDQWAQCGVCKSPSLVPELIAHLADEKACAMCGAAASAESVIRLDSTAAREALRQLAGVQEDEAMLADPAPRPQPSPNRGSEADRDRDAPPPPTRAFSLAQ